MLRKLAFAATSIFLLFPSILIAQATPAARSGGRIYVGGFFSVFHPDYGSNLLMGPGFYFDVDVFTHFGAEGEGRFLRMNQKLDVHEDNYLIGPRYRFHYHGLDPYVKFMMGNGQFNFPLNLAHGGYFVWAPGGGVDMNVSPHWRWRIIDYEYQHWNNFQNSSLTPNGFSFGISYRIF